MGGLVGQIKIKDHHSPTEAVIGAELGKTHPQTLRTLTLSSFTIRRPLCYHFKETTENTFLFKENLFVNSQNHSSQDCRQNISNPKSVDSYFSCIVLRKVQIHKSYRDKIILNKLG